MRLRESERIRLGSLEPRIVTEDICRSTGKAPRRSVRIFICHCRADAMQRLERMNRKYTTEEYENSMQIFCGNTLRHPAITTDVIVGFPGETEEEFAQTKEYLETHSFL